MKETIYSVIGVVGAIVAGAFGGWDSALTTLVIFMCVDYVLGLLLAGVFHKSQKSKSGKLDSNIGWAGLVKKGVSLLIVLVACKLDVLIGTTLIKDATVIAFITNEVLSIIENAGLMGVPVPRAITDAIEVLNKKSEKQDVNSK